MVRMKVYIKSCVSGLFEAVDVFSTSIYRKVTMIIVNSMELLGYCPEKCWHKECVVHMLPMLWAVSISRPFVDHITNELPQMKEWSKRIPILQ